ncbi:MAG: hypothetical protein IPJ94_21115 [Chloroflexi bacterium]|nr:hypothetical protein [Chloroflexota bacterium]
MLVYGPNRPALKRRAAKRRPVNGAFSYFSRFQPALLRSRGVYASAKLPYGPNRPALKRRAVKAPATPRQRGFLLFQPVSTGVAAQPGRLRLGETALWPVSPGVKAPGCQTTPRQRGFLLFQPVSTGVAAQPGRLRLGETALWPYRPVKPVSPGVKAPGCQTTPRQRGFLLFQPVSTGVVAQPGRLRLGETALWPVSPGVKAPGCQTTPRQRGFLLFQPVSTGVVAQPGRLRLGETAQGIKIVRV